MSYFDLLWQIRCLLHSLTLHLEKIQFIKTRDFLEKGVGIFTVKEAQVYGIYNDRLMWVCFFFFFWLSERGWQQEDTAAAGLQIQINQSIVLLNSSWFHLTENPSDVMFFKKKKNALILNTFQLF